MKKVDFLKDDDVLVRRWEVFDKEEGWIELDVKYLFIVDNWCLCSEYGGIWNVIAKDESECFDILLDEKNYNCCKGYLQGKIDKAQKYKLVDDLESKVVCEFVR